MTTKELKAVKSLRLKKDIRIHQADTGNCTVVFDESKYKEKLNILLESGVYEPLPKGPTAKVGRKMQKLLSISSETQFDSVPQQTLRIYVVSPTSTSRTFL
jgi:hypothetical protein